MVIAFYNIYFGLLTICDWFFFIYVVCHISIFFKVTNCDLKRYLLLHSKVVFLAFKSLLHNPFFEKNVKSIVLLR